MLKFHLLRARYRNKQAAESHRSQRMFVVGNYMYLKLQPYRQNTLKNRKIPHKLSPCYYGPFKVIDTIGSADYRLELPPEAAVHNVFHMSQLKLFQNPPTSSPTVPQFWSDLGTSKEPEVILETKMAKRTIWLSLKSWSSRKGNDLKTQHGSSTRTSLLSILISILEDKDDLEQGVL